MVRPKLDRSLSGVVGARTLATNFNRRFPRPIGLELGFKAMTNGGLPRFASQNLLGKGFGGVGGGTAWAKRPNLINSDAYKLAGIGRANLTAFGSVLSRNADFGVSTTVSRKLTRFAANQKSFLDRIAPLLEAARTGFYPANLRSIVGLGFEEVEAVVMLDGIALYGVPRSEIAEKIIRADTSAARREILGRRWKAISIDCRKVLAACTSSDVAAYAEFALNALDALDSGNPSAAQAMAAAVLDTVINSHFGGRRFALTPNRRTTTATAYEDLTVREFIAFAPLWSAYQRYRQEDGDPVPSTFSRHASVHGVSRRQFSRRNAVQAVLFVTSLLVFLDEAASTADAA